MIAAAATFNDLNALFFFSYASFKGKEYAETSYNDKFKEITI